MRPLLPGEREVLDVLRALHGEFGPEKQFTREAIERFRGEPSAGTLATLAMRGHVTQRSTPEGLAYRLTEKGREAAGQATKTSVRFDG